MLIISTNSSVIVLGPQTYTTVPFLSSFASRMLSISFLSILLCFSNSPSLPIPSNSSDSACPFSTLGLLPILKPPSNLPETNPMPFHFLLRSLCRANILFNSFQNRTSPFGSSSLDKALNPYNKPTSKVSRSRSFPPSLPSIPFLRSLSPFKELSCASRNRNILIKGLIPTPPATKTTFLNPFNASSSLCTPTSSLIFLSPISLTLGGQTKLPPTLTASSVPSISSCFCHNQTTGGLILFCTASSKS
ncbi:hypothetical protein ACMFMG_012204 [Clarireedia jacksonii]